MNKHIKENAEVGSGALAVLLAGVAAQYGIPLTPEMIAAGAAILVSIGSKLKNLVD